MKNSKIVIPRHTVSQDQILNDQIVLIFLISSQILFLIYRSTITINKCVLHNIFKFFMLQTPLITYLRRCISVYCKLIVYQMNIF